MDNKGDFRDKLEQFFDWANSSFEIANSYCKKAEIEKRRRRKEEFYISSFNNFSVVVIFLMVFLGKDAQKTRQEGFYLGKLDLTKKQKIKLEELQNSDEVYLLLGFRHNLSAHLQHKKKPNGFSPPDISRLTVMGLNPRFFKDAKYLLQEIAKFIC